ncbi:small hydrophilic protein [Streptomyces hydrogenans]|uniref:small hydrophilic protein n=1 Tax=Streptomyces hydrogenans TaxID=1873719 RepID=UPI0036AC2361
MSFTHRMAGLVAVVAVPLGIAATSYALTDEPAAPRVPPAVRLSTTPTATAPSTTPTDSVVPGPSATGDDDDDDHE